MQVGVSTKGFQLLVSDFTTNNTHTLSFTATQNTIYLNFRNFHNLNATSKLTNVSLKQVTPADNGAITNGATWLPAQSTIPQLGMMDWSKGSNLLTYSEDFSEWSELTETLW